MAELTGLLHVSGVADERKLNFLAVGGTKGTHIAANIREQENTVEEDYLSLQTRAPGGTGTIDTLKCTRQKIRNNEQNIQENRLLRVEANETLHILVLHDAKISGKEHNNL